MGGQHPAHAEETFGSIRLNTLYMFTVYTPWTRSPVRQRGRNVRSTYTECLWNRRPAAPSATGELRVRYPVRDFRRSVGVREPNALRNLDAVRNRGASRTLPRADFRHHLDGIMPGKKPVYRRCIDTEATQLFKTIFPPTLLPNTMPNKSHV